MFHAMKRALFWKYFKLLKKLINVNIFSFTYVTSVHTLHYHRILKKKKKKQKDCNLQKIKETQKNAINLSYF